MSKIRLFINHILNQGKSVLLNQKQSHYLRNVMRVSIGQTIYIFNGKDGEWESHVEEINKNYVKVQIRTHISQQKSSKDLCLCFALTKWDSMRNIVRQATELGVTELQPVLTDHISVKKINPEKLRLCAIEAAEQCERLTIPKICNLITFYEACHKYKDNLVICDESGQGKKPQDVFSNMKKSTILIGPEGGFSFNELNYKGPKRISLGNEILRVDTAVVSAITYLKAFLNTKNNTP